MPACACACPVRHVENNLFELWSLFEFLMPGFLGSHHAFQRGIVKPIKDGDAETLDYLRTRVRPFICAVLPRPEVGQDLPPKVESVTCCALEEAQAELYAALARKLRAQVLADVDEKGLAKSQMSILDALLKLRQICCHPRLLKIDLPGFSNNLPSGKFDAFKDMVMEIVEGGHKVLVFSQFVQMLQIIRQWLEFSQIPFCYLDGASKDRFEQVDRFNNSPDIPIFLISLKAGGTGLNLTSADYVIHYDRRNPPWKQARTVPTASARRGRCSPTSSSARTRWKKRSLKATGSQAWRGRGHHPRSGHLEVPDPRGSGDALRSLGDTAANSVITRRGSRALPGFRAVFRFREARLPHIRPVWQGLAGGRLLPGTPHLGEDTAAPRPPAATLTVPPSLGIRPRNDAQPPCAPVSGRLLQAASGPSSLPFRPWGRALFPAQTPAKETPHGRSSPHHAPHPALARHTLPAQ